MISTTTAVLAGLAIATSLASAGMAYYGQQQQARAAEEMAAYNYAIQKQQMEMQAQMAAMAAQQEFQAREYNAKVMENEAIRVEAEARDKARRMRVENERLLGKQLATYGSSGVTLEGSPLMVMAESAGALELAVADELYKSSVEASGFRNKAGMERWTGQYALIDEHAANYNKSTAGIRAGVLLVEGQNTAAALRTASYGSLLDGASSSFGMATQLSAR